MIKLVNVYKSFYQEKVSDLILEDINLEIEDNNIYTILGVSGSGKTTLLNIITGFEKYCSGQVIKKENLKIEYVTQQPHFLDELSVYNNLLFASYKTKGEARIIEYLRLFKCEHLKDRKPYKLSGGEKQRINIIRALINNPNILILDEPTASLDMENKNKICEEIITILNKNRISIILVTHDVEILNHFQNGKIFELKNKKLVSLNK